MNKNPNKSKELLEKALTELPRELTTVRFHVQRAINEITKVEDRSVKKQKATPWEKWKLDLNTGSMVHPNPNVANRALANLEAMIAKEQNKLNKSNVTPTTLLNG